MTITAVMVTFNRLELLKKTIQAYFDMDKRFDNIIIINNHSNDGTEEYLNEIKCANENIQVVNLDENIGGAGGFSLGVDLAMKNTTNDWIFLADDDAVPERDMIVEIEKVYNEISLNNDKDIAALCTSVISNGSVDFNHRSTVKKGMLRVKFNMATEDNYNSTYFDVDISTFVGLFVRRSVVDRIGLPNADFFIYHDDTEYSYRIRQCGRIICIPASRMIHDRTINNSNQVDWRTFYARRNYIYILKKYYPKRYVNILTLYWKLKYTSFLSKRYHIKKEERQLFKKAIKNGRIGKMGIEEEYRPKKI